MVGGTYSFTCGGDLYRLIKFRLYSLLYFAFPQSGGIGIALGNFDQTRLFLQHSSAHAPSGVARTVPTDLHTRARVRLGFQSKCPVE